jgi:large subunit ribosomal protein L15
MELKDLKVASGSRHLPKRVGRGLGSGMGKTSTRGQKGQGARQGRKVAPGFEGGNLPLFRRVPKHGFVSPNRVTYYNVTLEDLNGFEDGAEVNLTSLFIAGLVPDLKKGVKILANGKLERKLSVKAQGFSAAAKAAIEEKGGVAEVENLKAARIAFNAALEDLADSDEEAK